MFDYHRIYKDYVNNSISEILQPKVLIGTELIYPKDSMLFWYKCSDDLEYISKDLPYFFTTYKPVVRTITEYSKEANHGRFKHINIPESKIISKFKKFETKMKFIKSNVKKLSISYKQEFIYNLASLNHFYKYNHEPLEELHKWFNSFLTLMQLVKNENSGNQRHKFIILGLPSAIPTHTEIMKYMDTISPSELKTISEIESLNIIDLYRLLHSKYRTKSLFAQIPYNEYENITLVFHFNGNVSLFNLKDLFSLNKAYNIDSKLPKYDDNTIMKILTIMFKRIILTPGRILTSSILESEFSNIVEREEDKPVNIDRELEEIEDEVEVKKNINKKTIDEEFKEIETNEVAEEYDSDYEINDIKELKSVKETEDDVILKEVEVLKEKKLITNTEYKNIHEALEKQKKQKPVYPEVGETIAIARTYNIEEFKIREEEKKLPDNVAIIDKSMNESTLKVLNKKYIKEVYKKDVLNAIYGIQKSGNVILDHKMEVQESILGKQEMHTLVVKPINGHRTTIKLIIPSINEKGEFKLSGNTYVMRYQKADLIIRKFNQVTVGLATYYGKVTITKDTYKKDDPSFYVVKLMTERFKEGIVKNLVAVPVDNMDVELPNQYQMISRTIKSFTYKGINFYFEYVSRNTLVNKDKKLLEKIESKDKILVGVKGKTYYLIDNLDIVYEYKDGKLNRLVNLVEFLDIPKDKLPVEYANIKLFKLNVPVGIVLSYYLGFDKLLKTTKVKHKKLNVNERYQLSEDEYFIKFKDYKYVITKDYGENDLIFGGFKSIEKILKTYTKNVFSNKEQMTAIFNSIGMSVLHVNELTLLRRLFVDDISKSILEELNEPTTFVGLLIRAVEILADYNYKHPNDIENMRFKGYERIAGFIYKEMVNAIRIANNKSYFGKSKIEVNPYSVLKKISEDSNVMLEDDLNPMVNIKQKADTSVTGEGGRNADTMTKITREMHPSEIGIVSEHSKDSGNVGVSGSVLSANPNIKSVRGLVDVKDIKDLSVTNIMSMSALLYPFSTKDDVKRLSFISGMDSHVVPIKDMKVPYVRTGYEQVLPLLANDKYVISAEEEGIVEKVTKDNITVKYKKLGVKKYKLKQWNTKEESGATYTHKLITSLKPKDKFKEGDTIAYDYLFFEPDVFNKKRVIVKTGTLLNVAMKDIPQTYEDSGVISGKIDKRMGLNLTKVKSFILDKDINIFDMVNIGDEVTPNQPLFSMMDANVSKEVGVDKKTLAILQDLKAASPKAKVEGKIVNIKIFYNFDLETAPKTLQKIIKESDERLLQHEGFTGRVNSTYSVQGKKLLEDTMEIKVYINVNEGMGIGDKAVVGNQLKFTVGEVFNYDILTDDGRDVELLFSYLSVAARIVNSPELIGTTSTLLEKVSMNACDMYFNRSK